jgi:hypothetical protein
MASPHVLRPPRPPRSQARRRARAISPRNRKRIARWLRRTATHSQQSHPLVRSRETLLSYRVAAVRTELLQLAAMVERALDPDPAAMVALRDLLANGCDSPLYNAEIHISELRAALYYARAGLTARPTVGAPSLKTGQ